ncbi:hypothetical protein C9423_07090 [Lactobacillus sp. Koumiss]|nr:hypothetical protein C9423_07090 [Lactobacillus sp. Koumiss]RYT02378.1 hypothetical protein EAI85_11180 [Enterococcus durans]
MKFPKNLTFGCRLFKKELLLLPPFIREPVAKLIFRFVPHSFVYFENHLSCRWFRKALNR